MYSAGVSLILLRSLKPRHCEILTIFCPGSNSQVSSLVNFNPSLVSILSEVKTWQQFFRNTSDFLLGRPLSPPSANPKQTPRKFSRLPIASTAPPRRHPTPA